MQICELKFLYEIAGAGCKIKKRVNAEAKSVKMPGEQENIY
jgi:hypothetical protein